MKTQATGYCRVSSTGQQTTGTGLDRQEKVIKAYARKAGYRIIEIYLEAITGTETDRPVFDNMLADLLDNGCRVIIVESLDRLARDLAVQMRLIALLTSKGIALLNASTGQNVTESMESDPMLKAMINMQGVFSELDKNLLVRKLRKGREAAKAKSGRCEGRKPYGYYPGEQEVLDRIKQLRKKPHGEPRMNFSAVARTLNAEGHKARFGGEWSGVVIKRIIKK